MRLSPRRAPRAVVAAVLGAGAGAALLALFALVQLAIGPATAWIAALLAAVVLAATIAWLEPARRRIEALLAPRAGELRDRIHRAVCELALARDEEGVLALVRDALGAESVALAAKPVADAVAAKPAPGAAFVAFPREAPIAGGLALTFRDGALRLGPRERALLETLTAQAAVAIANARVWEEVRDLERRTREENAYLREAALPAAEDGDLVGRSLALRSVLAQVRQVAPTDANVLVLGETGTGKELVVREIHRLSRRAGRPLVQVACAALPESLLESELFGHEKGAFTGATARKLGRFEVADGGTLFLDDVDTLPLAIQPKLLRAIQEGEVQRLGSDEVRIADVRVVAASNRDLLALVRAGRFREDLYYRLHVIPIRLPPLRDRLEDVPLLVEHFARREGARLGRPVREIPPETIAALQAHRWPGNVRELRNVVERAIVLSPDGVLRLGEPLAAEHLAPACANGAADLGKASLAELMRRYKTRLVRTALARSGGNQRRAAELLGIHRPSLARMLRDLDLGEERASD